MTTIDLTTKAFNTKQVSAIVSATARQIIHWDKTGLVKPSVRSAAGRGSSRLYSYHDLLSLKTVTTLRKDEISLQRIRRCVQYLRKHLPNVAQPLGSCTLVAAGETIYLVTGRKSSLIDTVRRPGQHAFSTLMLDVSGMDHELRQLVRKYITRHVEPVDVGDFSYQVEIEPDAEDGGYVATVAGLRGCVTDGDTIEEVLANARDAIGLWVEAREDLKNRGIPVPMRQRRQRRKRA